MKVRETELLGVFVVEAEPFADERGSFTTVFSREELAQRGLPLDVAQTALSFNLKRGTLRGLHYQEEPHGQTKLVRCSRGALFDVVVDVRRESKTRHKWIAVELSEKNRLALFIPRGFAHGFLTLEDATEITYEIGGAYRPESERGLRFDDPALGVKWPFAPSVIGKRDASFPYLAP